MQTDKKVYRLEGRHYILSFAYAGRHSPSVCAGHAWAPEAELTRPPQGSTLQLLIFSAESAAFFQVLCKETIGRSWEVNITLCCCAAVTVLWLSLALACR